MSRYLKQLFHAYISAGNICDTLAAAAVCSGDGEKPCLVCAHCVKASRRIHPDIAVIAPIPPGREIVVDQIRELQRDIFVVPNESDKKAYVIEHADLMNIAAQNALLRILEEPPGHAVFILKTENPVALLPTVRSRCVKLGSLPEADNTDPGAEELADDFFTALKCGNAELMEFSFRLDKLDRAELAVFVTAARKLAAESFKDGALPPEILTRTDKALVRAGEYLDVNVGTGHISGMICASLITD